MILLFLAFIALFDACALLLLYQWRGIEPWARVDLFSGGYLVLSTLLAAMQVFSMRNIAPSRDSFRAFTAHDIDPSWKYWILALSLAEFAVFLDYGHLRLSPWLERGVLQGIGLGLYLAAAGWMFATGRYLSRNYERARRAGGLLTDGPYAAMRHPLYSALIVTRIGFALLLASVIAWVLAVLWICRIAQRIRREEAHLRREFGDLYEAYARRTPALLHASAGALFRR